jgi:hypothetical protein
LLFLLDCDSALFLGDLERPFGLRFPSFISVCGLGGIRPRAAIRRLVPINSSSCVRAMPEISIERDRLKLSHTFSLGMRSVVLPNLKSQRIKEIAVAFKNNIDSLKFMMLTPAFVGDLAIRMQRLNDIAELEILGAVRANDDAYEQGTKVYMRMRELFNEQTQQLAEIKKSAADMEKLVKARIETGGAYAILLADVRPGSLGLEAMLRSYITGIWTAFEIMAGDLWEAAVNEAPNKFAKLKGHKNRLQKNRQQLNSGTEEVTIGDEESKLVNLNLIEFHRWDLRDKMGTILRRRYSFSRLEGIREAYACAFHEKSEQIDKALSNMSFDALSAVRNVIVHRSGIADDDYVRRTKYLPSIPQMEKGAEILLDGELVAKMMIPIIDNGMHLIKSVDERVQD